MIRGKNAIKTSSLDGENNERISLSDTWFSTCKSTEHWNSLFFFPLSD